MQSDEVIKFRSSEVLILSFLICLLHYISKENIDKKYWKDTVISYFADYHFYIQYKNKYMIHTWKSVLGLQLTIIFFID